MSDSKPEEVIVDTTSQPTKALKSSIGQVVVEQQKPIGGGDTGDQLNSIKIQPLGGANYQLQKPIPENPIPIPENISGVPPGLEYLNVLDVIFVRQQIEILEITSGRHMPNRYDIFNAHNELIYRAIEGGNPISTMYSGSNRNFNIVIYDAWGRPVISLHRPWTLGFQEILTVCSPPGIKIGTVDTLSFFSLIVRNVSEEPILKVESLGGGNCCTTGIGTVNFNIWNLDNSIRVGAITKQYAGYIQEATTAADNFVITFPKDLHATTKGTLIGACLLLDFMYFEHVQNNNRHNHGGYGYGGYGHLGGYGYGGYGHHGYGYGHHGYGYGHHSHCSIS